MLALLAALENVIPPLPADTAIALGAFLSTRGVTDPLTVFLVTWTANVAGLAGVYLAARRLGRSFSATPIGRRLVSPGALATIEREYVKYGPLGLFVARLLPGIRAVAPPFAGIVHLAPARALVPLALASGLWYGGVTWLASRLGVEWDAIVARMAQVNTALAAVAAVVAGVAAVGLLRAWRRHQEASDAAALDRIEAVAPEVVRPVGAHGELDPRALALLLLEQLRADDVLTDADRHEIEAGLRGERTPAPLPVWPAATDLGRGSRVRLVESMVRDVLRDAQLGRYEHLFLERAAALLELPPGELAEVRDLVRGHAGP